MSEVLTASTVEAPSGKDAAYENFPVGSWLLPARLRPHVAVFYAFARAIDDIADSPRLTAEMKISRLEGFARALKGEALDPVGYAKAYAMRETLAATGISEAHCLDLIAAFKQDAFKRRYADWSELIDYCYKSAAPVGRFLIDLHGGCRYGYAAADALCNALQIINHLQDCRDDYLDLDRVYLPQDWLAEAHAAVDDLARHRCTPALRRVFDRALDGVETLLAEARPLPRQLSNRRLAMEAAAIIDIAYALVRRLRCEDPLAARVHLSKLEYAWSVGRGAVSVWV
jgi:squalene synthase HpnC